MPKAIKVKSTDASTLEDRNSTADESLPMQFDALNAAITQAETRLRSLKPIKSVWHNYDTDCSPEGVPEVEHFIGFCKLDEKWRIAYSPDDGSGPNHPIYPLTDCKIETRVCAARHIPKLHELIVASKEEFIIEVDNVISVLRSFAQKS